MPSKYRVTLALSEEQHAFLMALSEEIAEYEGKKRISPAEAVRRALAEHYGEAWPNAEISWGGFAPEARAGRWPEDDSDQEETKG